MNKEETNSKYTGTITTTPDFEIKTIEEKNGMFSCWIPAVDSYFSASSIEEISSRGSAMIKAFIQFWNEYNNNGQPKDFSSMKQ